MEGQMTIWDFMESSKANFHTMTEKEIVDYVGNALGLEFKWSDFFEQYICKTKGMILDLALSTYLVGIGDDEVEEEKFISVGCSAKHAGGGCPCDSLEEAVEWFREAIRSGRYL